MANRIKDWGQATQKHEGYYPGSRSYRNHNPGNFRCAEWLMKEFNAVRCEDNFIVFPDYATGLRALEGFLTYAASGQLKNYRATMTLASNPNAVDIKVWNNSSKEQRDKIEKDGKMPSFYQVYAPSADGNNPKNYGDDIIKQLGVPVTTMIKDLYEAAPAPIPTPKIVIENQLDTKKWGKWYLGKVKTSSFEKFGCFLFCWSYLYSLKKGKQILPSEVDGIFVKHGVYSGDLIDSVKAAKALGFEYLGKETDINKPPAWHPTIKEVDFSIAGGKQQHFVVRTKVDGKNVILDPYGGVQRAINYYEKKTNAPNWENGHFSYRLIK